jgi:DNA repair exonuclease SbcCD ATPase subunit
MTFLPMGQGDMDYWHRADVSPTKLVGTLKDELESKMSEMRRLREEFDKRCENLKRRDKRMKELEKKEKDRLETFNEDREKYRDDAKKMAEVISDLWRKEEEWARAEGRVRAQTSIFSEYTKRIGLRAACLVSRNAQAIAEVEQGLKQVEPEQPSWRERIEDLLRPSDPGPSLSPPGFDLRRKLDEVFAQIAQNRSDADATATFRVFQTENAKSERDFIEARRIFLLGDDQTNDPA